MCHLIFYFFGGFFCAMHVLLKGERTLSLLVENCGRVNYGKSLDEQRKGICVSLV